jgi:hypothetical protein
MTEILSHSWLWPDQQSLINRIARTVAPTHTTNVASCVGPGFSNHRKKSLVRWFKWEATQGSQPRGTYSTEGECSRAGVDPLPPVVS